MDGFREGRHIVGRITIDKNYFVSRVREHFGDAIEANGSPLMKIIAI